MKMTSIIFLAIFLALGVANAEIITIEVTATVTMLEDNGSNGGYFGGNISLGDTLVMTYSYDTKTPNSNPYSPPHPSGNNGIYNQSAPNMISVTVGGYSFESDTSNLDYYISLTRSSTDDSYQVTSTNNIFPTEGYLAAYSMSWQISYLPDTFTNTELPIAAPDIENSYVNRIWIDGYRNFQIFATPVSVQIVPEPMTILMFGLGGLIVFRKRDINNR